MLKLNIHSITDIITNSSTVIFTYSGGSQDAVRQMVDEMLRVFDREETFDDIFDSGVFLDDNDYYDEFIPEDEEDKSNKFINETILKVVKKEIKKPDWMIEAEEDGNGDGYDRSTTLYLEPRDEKYKDLAEKIIKFLYSTGNEACYG